MKKLLLSLLILILLGLFLLSANNIEARSGCCSWHGGVCTYKCPDGINVGYKCCDGTSLSATCAPYYPKCPAKTTPTCPVHSTYNSLSGSCECNYGYIVSGSECIDADTYCYNKYGSHSSYDTSLKNCQCEYGYTLDSSNKCVARDKYCQDLYGHYAYYSSLKGQCECNNGYKLSDNECVKEEIEDIQQPIEEFQIQENAQTENKENDSDKLKAQISEGLLDRNDVENQNNRGWFIWWWIIGIGFAGCLFYIFKKRQ